MTLEVYQTLIMNCFWIVLIYGGTMLAWVLCIGLFDGFARIQE